MSQPDLFGSLALQLPQGMRFQEEFLSHEEEASLAGIIERLPLANMKYQQYEALRRVVSYGGQYDFSAQRLNAAEPLPAWLDPLRARAAAWIGIDPAQFTQALVAEYRPGTPLGWHRDVPDHELVAGISLLGAARMRLRPFPHVASRGRSARGEVIAVELAPRSAYLLRGPARWDWQHSIAPTQELRYSITLRTPRQRAGSRTPADANHTA
jgi:alkylated DNA repair dioxygenase AlkB